MKVGAAPPKRKQVSKDIDQSAVLTKATVSKKGRRKRTKRRVQIDDDEEEEKTQTVATSLFSAPALGVEADEKRDDDDANAKNVSKLESVGDDDGDSAVMNLFDDEEDAMPTINAKTPEVAPKQNQKQKAKDMFGSDSDEEEDPLGLSAPVSAKVKVEDAGEMSRSGVKIDVSKLRMGGGPAMTVKQIRAQRAKAQSQSQSQTQTKSTANAKDSVFGDSSDEDEMGAVEKVVESEKVSVKKDATEEAFEKYFGGKDKAISDAENEKEKEKVESAMENKGRKSSGSGKLADKFAHLNIDPSKMKVGAAPPRKTKAFASGAAEKEVVEDKEITQTEDSTVIAVKSSEDREIDELFGSDDDVDVVATQPASRAKAKTSPVPDLEKETPSKAKVKSNLFDSDSDDDWTSKRAKPKRKETDDFDSLFD